MQPVLRFIAAFVTLMAVYVLLSLVGIHDRRIVIVILTPIALLLLMRFTRRNGTRLVEVSSILRRPDRRIGTELPCCLSGGSRVGPLSRRVAPRRVVPALPSRQLPRPRPNDADHLLRGDVVQVDRGHRQRGVPELAPQARRSRSARHPAVARLRCCDARCDGAAAPNGSPGPLLVAFRVGRAGTRTRRQVSCCADFVAAAPSPHAPLRLCS